MPSVLFCLIAIFPISKLLHAPGIFFSPTLNQVDNARKRRHISDWASKKDNDLKIELENILPVNFSSCIEMLSRFFFMVFS